MSNPSSGISIIVAEDDRLLAELTAEILREEGHTVFNAHSAEGALSLLQKYPAVGVLLSDINMPGGSGISLAETTEVRSRRLVVVLTSARLVTDCELPPGTMFLQKPFTARQLLTIVDASRKTMRGAAGTDCLPDRCA